MLELLTVVLGIVALLFLWSFLDQRAQRQIQEAEDELYRLKNEALFEEHLNQTFTHFGGCPGIVRFCKSYRLTSEPRPIYRCDKCHQLFVLPFDADQLLKTPEES